MKRNASNIVDLKSIKMNQTNFVREFPKSVLKSTKFFLNLSKIVLKLYTTVIYPVSFYFGCQSLSMELNKA